MATASTTLFMTNDTDAHFRAWAQWIHDQLAAFGWVQTSDTGQINLTTVTVPGSATAAGYEIWRMADALQTANPVFMKLEYGSGNSVGTHPGLWITLATASSGAGSLSGTQITARSFMPAQGFATSAVLCYASGSTSRFCFGMGQQVAGSPTVCYMMFGVERTKNSDGSDSTEGAHALAFADDANQGTGAFWHMALTFSGPIPAVELLGSGDFPSAVGQTSSIVGNDTFTYSIQPMIFYPRNPIMNWVLGYSIDFTREVAVSIDFYGIGHTYLPYGNGRFGNTASNPTMAQKSTARFLMRYE